ncbi:MAG: D-sedoheptulose-7-phosphate isomerase [Actinomycetales bacterium]
MSRHPRGVRAGGCGDGGEGAPRAFARPGQHARELAAVLERSASQLDLLTARGAVLAARLRDGARLIAAGNGGSAAEAQHLTAELVGRLRDDRAPMSAIALCAETSSLTAIVNDYGSDAMFARQVLAHGRPGDVVLLLSTSGSSSNLLAAADAAKSAGIEVWSFTGPDPNPLAAMSDWSLCIDAPDSATIQEVHLVAVHALCAAVDVELGVAPWAGEAAGTPQVVDLREPASEVAR